MKILLASDGSEPAVNAARFFSRLKMDENPELVLLTVSMNPELTVHGNVANPEWEAKTKELVSRQQSELENLLFGCFDGSLSKLHETGNPAVVILEVAERIDADLIVLGAIGHSMVSRMLLGSVSDRVATHAKCSVLVVRPRGDNRLKHSPPKRIIIAYDDSEPSRESVNELTNISWGRDTEITVLSVANSESSLLGDELPPESRDNVSKMTEALGQSAEHLAKSLADAIPLSSAHVLTGGHAAEAIVCFAQENESDLILIGDSGHSQLHDFFLGSTTKYVLRHAPCSVWISRRRQSDSKG